MVTVWFANEVFDEVTVCRQDGDCTLIFGDSMKVFLSQKAARQLVQDIMAVEGFRFIVEPVEEKP